MPGPHLTRIFRPRVMAITVLATASMLLSACISPGSAGGAKTVAMIPNYQGGGGAVQAQPNGYPANKTVISVELGDTSASSMFIHMSQSYAPQGPVTFLITNSSTTMDHELVGFLTKIGAADYQVSSFDGQANRVNEDTAGVAVVDTGAALKPGQSQMLTVDMKSGHYAMVCNLAGHYAAGMHQDFYVTPPGSTPVSVELGDTSASSMFIHMSQSYAPQGPVTFLITNSSTTMDHELVGFLTKIGAADYQVSSFDGQANRVNEDTAGVAVVDTGAALKPGQSQMLTVDMKSGHYAMVCNLAGHYAAGMHQDFYVTPTAA